MATRDFLTYCTKLKPIELRALGEFSNSLHMEKDTVIYEKGDASDCLYIISRGVLEVIWEDITSTKKPVSSCYLSRGDILGTIGVMTGVPRANTVRTCEPVSLLCIQKENLKKLVEKVPSFMFYLAEELSWQLMHVNDATIMQSNCLELSGSLANFDLVTVFQTLLQSSQKGELVIADGNDEPVAKFHFDEGSPVYGQFGHLLGDEALWQLFLRDIPDATFSFAILNEPTDRSGPLTAERGSNDLLLNALRSRDEFLMLLEDLPDINSTLMVSSPELNWTGPAESAPIVEAMWTAVFDCPTRIEELFEKLNWCELTLYRVLRELLTEGHLVARPCNLPRNLNNAKLSPVHPKRIPNTNRVVRHAPVAV